MKKCIFIHIPKTGGSTTKNVFAFQYKDQLSIIHPGFDLEDLKSLNNHDKNKISCLYGVFPYGVHQLLPWEKVNYATVIRHPVKRMISLYNYFCKDMAEGFHEIMPENERKDIKSFIENVDKYTLVHGNNAQTRLLAGSRLNNDWDDIDGNKNVDEDIILEQAKSNIENHFEFIGITEKYDKSLILAKKHFFFSRPLFYLKRNITKKREPMICQNAIELIKKKNKLDLELYDYTSKKLKKEIAANKSFVDLEKMKLNFNNRLYYFYRKFIRPSLR